MQLPPYRPRRRDSNSRLSFTNHQSKNDEKRVSYRSSLNLSNFSTSRDIGGRSCGTTSYRSRSLDNFRSSMMHNNDPPFIGGVHTLERAHHRSKGAEERHNNNNQDHFSMSVAEESLDRWRMGFRDIPALASPARGESGYISPRSRTSYTMSTGGNVSFGCEYRHGHHDGQKDNINSNTTRNISTTRPRNAEPSPVPISLSPGTNWSYNNSEDVNELRSIITKLVNFNRQLRSIIKQSLESHRSLNFCQRCREDLRMVSSASLGPHPVLKNTTSLQDHNHKSMLSNEPKLLRNDDTNNITNDYYSSLNQQQPNSSRNGTIHTNHPTLPLPPKSSRLGRPSPRGSTARSTARSNYQYSNIENVTPDRFKPFVGSGNGSGIEKSAPLKSNSDYVMKNSNNQQQHSNGRLSDRYSYHNNNTNKSPIRYTEDRSCNVTSNNDRVIINNNSPSNTIGRESSTNASYNYGHWRDHRMGQQSQQSRLTYASTNQQSGHLLPSSDRLNRDSKSGRHPPIPAPKLHRMEHQEDGPNCHYNTNVSPTHQYSDRYSTTTLKIDNKDKSSLGYVIPALRLDVVGKGKWLSGEVTNGDTYD